MMDNLLGYDNIVLIPHPWNEAALERPNNVVWVRSNSIHNDLGDNFKENIT